jgi:hypothetical protein
MTIKRLVVGYDNSKFTSYNKNEVDDTRTKEFYNGKLDFNTSS